MEKSARLLTGTTADSEVRPLLKQHTRHMSLASYDRSSCHAEQAGAFFMACCRGCKGTCQTFSATGLFLVMAVTPLLLARQAQAHSGLVSTAQSLQHHLLPVIEVFSSRQSRPFTNAKTPLNTAPPQPHRNLAASSEAGLTSGLPLSASFGRVLPNMVKSLKLNKHCSIHLASIMTSTSCSLP